MSTGNALATAPHNETSLANGRKSERALAPVSLGQRGIELRSMDDLWRFAAFVQKSNLAPRGLQTVEQIAIAIECGMELGLSPMAALRTIAVINGRPSVWGDGFLGIIEASGQVADRREAFTGSAPTDKAKFPDTFTATCVVNRKNGREAVGTFSVADAKRAKLWQKQGTWQEYPQIMLMWRARGIALRSLFPDILMGLPLTEETLGAEIVQAAPQRATFDPSQVTASNEANRGHGDEGLGEIPQDDDIVDQIPDDEPLDEPANTEPVKLECPACKIRFAPGQTECPECGGYGVEYDAPAETPTNDGDGELFKDDKSKKSRKQSGVFGS